MPRTLRDSKLETRDARARLKVQGRPHWRLIEPGLHLGYRRLSGKPGTWCVRRYGGEQIYHVEAIKGVVADDYSDADGRTVLSFAQAQRVAAKSKPKAGPFTVREAIALYLEGRVADARADPIVAELGDLKVEALTTARLRKWLLDLSNTPRRMRTRKGEPQRYFELDDSNEARRQRRASANRVFAILKAALNFAWREGHIASDEAWRRVQPFAGTVRSRLRYLTPDECQRLVNAAEPYFRPLVQAGLLTGCRYSELARLTVGDVHAGTIHITRSKSGKPRHVVLNAEAVALFARLVAGRDAGDLLFHTARGAPWRKGTQQGPMRIACQRARIKPAVGFHVLRHTWASLAIMSGAALIVVAKNLGHVSTKMCEQHYGHLSRDFMAEEIRKHAPSFGFKPDSKVVGLAGRTS